MEAELGVVGHDAGDGALVQDAALLHEDDRVEEEEGLRGGLVDSEQDRAVAGRHTLQQAHQAE